MNEALIAAANKKKITSEVFVTFRKILKTSRRDDCSIIEITAALPHLEEEQIKEVLKELDAGDKLFLE